jgi:hypothetical protein
MGKRRFFYSMTMAGALALVGCSSGGSGSNPGTGGRNGSGGSSGSGGASGSGGSASGSGGAGTGGATQGTGGGSGGTDAASDVPANADGPAPTSMSFFVTSDTSKTGNLGGLTGADKRCQDLATAAGQGGKTWHAYLSAEMGPAGAAVNAKDRIGTGPWYNVKGALIAMNLTDLHARNGDYMLFLDEKGKPINGHWPQSPTPVEHDLLTGSNRDGTLKPMETCQSWTSGSAADHAWVGHSDGLGPNGTADPALLPWNSAHENGNCMDTAPKGGAGRLACFAVN